ncbi:septum formation inhibitor Maf [Leptolyngbya sp. FACHB-321]|uniref:Maf family protein n=1 Tax=Leptolyngbya sp. FACHB-321 TaxID=2692807 RepID=UPI0016844BFC|nr:nucleoside triphosphate pyrophosphatase [Leptolyngbya sp. FACHB-321]MBD2038063.1 septum formation inhibitor Maf [Leptolyngbya sp. FACHB-321]
MGVPQFILASASSARLRLLRSVGIEPIVCPSAFDESQVQLSDPAALVQALALNKATTVATQLDRHASVDRLVLGCDSVLAVNGEIHGKPAGTEEAIERWQQMRGQVGRLYTGHALLVIPPTPHTPSPTPLVRCQITQVYFATVSDRQIAAYAATGEPLHCAGAFALEGKGGLFVEKIDGCHSNVIGLSLPLLRQMLDDRGYDVTAFWSIDPQR